MYTSMFVFLHVWLSYAFLPISLHLWLVGGYAHTIGSWRYSELVMFDCFHLGGGFSLSHDEVKRAVALFYSFVFTIARAPCGFLYLTTNTGY